MKKIGIPMSTNQAKYRRLSRLEMFCIHEVKEDGVTSDLMKRLATRIVQKLGKGKEVGRGS